MVEKHGKRGRVYETGVNEKWQTRQGKQYRGKQHKVNKTK